MADFEVLLHKQKISSRTYSFQQAASRIIFINKTLREARIFLQILCGPASALGLSSLRGIAEGRAFDAQLLPLLPFLHGIILLKEELDAKIRIVELFVFAEETFELPRVLDPQFLDGEEEVNSWQLYKPMMLLS